MYAEYLGLLQWKTDEAEDGQEALAKAVAHRPSVIVTETRLPNLSGLELCRQLRSDPATAGTRIVILTSHALGHELALAWSVDADVVLTKPCLPMALNTTLSRVLAGAAHDGPRRAHLIRGVHHLNRTVGDNRRISARFTAETSRVAEHLLCPACSQPLSYLESHVSAVGHYPQEQWDYFKCVDCGATYEYRQRTRTLRACLTGVLPISEIA